MKIDAKSEDLEIVRSILTKYLPSTAKVWVFGSRATGKAKPYSDLDLALDFGRPITLHEFALLNTEFENSLLPYKVDVVDLWSVDKNFVEIINSSKTTLI